MTRRQLHLTVSLLKVAKRMEMAIDRFEQVGVTVLPLEDAQIELLYIFLQVHGIHRDSEHADYLLEPIFDHLNSKISRPECVKQFNERLQELKQGRRVSGVG